MVSIAATLNLSPQVIGEEVLSDVEWSGGKPLVVHVWEALCVAVVLLLWATLPVLMVVGGPLLLTWPFTYWLVLPVLAWTFYDRDAGATGGRRLVQQALQLENETLCRRELCDRDIAPCVHGCDASPRCAYGHCVALVVLCGLEIRQRRIMVLEAQTRPFRNMSRRVKKGSSVDMKRPMACEKTFRDSFERVSAILRLKEYRDITNMKEKFASM